VRMIFSVKCIFNLDLIKVHKSCEVPVSYSNDCVHYCLVGHDAMQSGG
jgi:hypothetical protein